MTTHRRSAVFARSAWLTAALVLVALLAGCGSGPTTSPPAASVGLASPSAALPSPAGSRPSSPAVVTIDEPKPNAQVTGSTVHVVIGLQNATIVPATTTNLRPDQGHIHLYVDNVLVSMNYGLTQDLPVHPGTYVLKAEFVAADHAPFDPRVWSDQIAFTVK
ncbi:MAG TPA: DUF4399 domain-containing protein [Candidatus Acidoferrum sp.]|nr:DUF4399 domain-containing protein [Candidatus Acidoferrum sp.]